jgi:predicted nucleic acid-binding protein
MATTPPSRPTPVVIDANVLVALCAKEAGTYPVALAQMRLYVRGNHVAHGPGVLVAEVLFSLYRKLQNAVLTTEQHARAIQHLRVRMRGILPPPGGDGMLTWRAEQIRGTYGCSRSADGLYIALAEQLAQTGPAELVTFDAGMQQQAAITAPTVTIRLLTFP